MTIFGLLIFLVAGVISYKLIIKPAMKEFNKADVEEGMDNIADTREMAEKIEGTDTKEYRKDKKAVDKFKEDTK